MDEYGKLFPSNGRYALQFERFFPFSCEKVFQVITDPEAFTKWYPFATGEMDLKEGGRIQFDDGEGAAYEAVILDLKPPHVFNFREIEDLIEISLQEENEGCRFFFTHTFDDQDMVEYVAAGWHRCIDVLEQIVHGQQVKWKYNASELRETYKKQFS
ncbi:SRPBCC family protein [Halobacillus sp. Marseille-P3879]|uniref:SRPBCC family protein n=1 Tax=Halobacillus sp. Marseille-P3879 TaxID=2045014 RepID=UPI000C7E4CCF|nr:SRPBCC family protein [Halobacillus sp. Marseille-P3879]